MNRVDPEILFSNQPFAAEILARLQDRGYDAYVVGGSVRDILLSKIRQSFNIDPEKLDVDIATDASIDEIKSIFRDQKIIEVGARFGVLIVIGPGGKQYEIAHFREEKNYDGRKPERVDKTDSLQKDVERRDFTINGLAMKKNGRIIDYVRGIEDLKSNIIRAIGNPERRFNEDLLRSLRAIRFACSLNAKIERKTFSAIKKVANRITEISWERIREEFFKILEADCSSKGMKLMLQTGLLHQVLPELTASMGVQQPEKYHPEGDVFQHSLQALEKADVLKFSPLVKFAVLLHDVGKEKAQKKNEGEHTGGHSLIGSKMARTISERFRLSNEEKERLCWLIENHMRGAAFPKMNRAKQVRMVRTRQNEEESIDKIPDRFSYFADLLRVIIADSEASVHRSDGWLPVLEEVTDLLPHIRELELGESAREMIDGNDLKEMGMKEGPALGEVLHQIHRKILGGQIKSRKEALNEAEKTLETQD